MGIGNELQGYVLLDGAQIQKNKNGTGYQTGSVEKGSQ
jgi:hypothetical protein